MRSGCLQPERSIVVLREARVEDVPVLVRILIDTKEGSGGPFDPHDRDLEFWSDRWRSYIATGSRAQHSLGDGIAILATVEDDVIGFAAFHHTRRFGCDAELESIYVLPGHQRRGTGTALLREIVRLLRAGGSGSLCVGYSPDNPHKRFYFKHGAIEINPHWAAWRSLGALTSSTGIADE
jgi:GNAT superfamily N-acetyltransferase